MDARDLDNQRSVIGVVVGFGHVFVIGVEMTRHGFPPVRALLFALEAPFLHQVLERTGHLQQALPLVTSNDAASMAA
jgi:hypothetical protein